MGNLIKQVSKLFFSSKEKEDDREIDNFCMRTETAQEIQVTKKTGRPPLNLTAEEQELMAQKSALKNKEKMKRYRERHKDKIKAYREQNKEKMREYYKEYREKNREKVLARLKERYREDIEGSREYHRERYRKNREAIIERTKTYLKEHPEVVAKSNHRYYYANQEELKRKRREKYARQKLAAQQT
ncbi:hypothetical protein [Borrelia sp. RT1S]|uniref:hypothetical protein n=1 Tax=Borrelia sp. RT1S TaxID=2898580 RepID=UPI001E2C619D|nr:hypothetical protein [Borrelia sp. RT1S]UGQ17696.1 hypothetical protein LSO05_04530 [Borrelia sp. RT1S]UGQ17789.1 hypothetical protein LSO05_05005 [Borrelia sp. RT1S]